MYWKDVERILRLVDWKRINNQRIIFFNGYVSHNQRINPTRSHKIPFNHHKIPYSYWVSLSFPIIFFKGLTWAARSQLFRVARAAAGAARGALGTRWGRAGRGRQRLGVNLEGPRGRLCETRSDFYGGFIVVLWWFNGIKWIFMGFYGFMVV